MEEILRYDDMDIIIIINGFKLLGARNHGKDSYVYGNEEDFKYHLGVPVDQCGTFGEVQDTLLTRIGHSKKFASIYQKKSDEYDPRTCWCTPDEWRSYCENQKNKEIDTVKTLEQIFDEMCKYEVNFRRDAFDVA